MQKSENQSINYQLNPVLKNPPSPIIPTPLVEVIDDITTQAQIKFYIKRDDLIHSTISGNKWRKLKFNIHYALHKNLSPIITFGGAYSNHLYATAAACALANIPCFGIVRGDELHENASPTLTFCTQKGMKLVFVSRSEYRLKEEGKTVKELLQQTPNAFIVPEGGANEQGVNGMQELYTEVIQQLGYQPSYLCVAAGTGSSAAGLIKMHQPTLVVSALKGGDFLRNEIQQFAHQTKKQTEQWLTLFTDYHCGGYGKYTPELIDFIHWFQKTHRIPLEQVYTGKVVYSMYDLIKKKYFPEGSTLVVIHTGGLQGSLPILRYPLD